jgi:hypothetical protein
LVQLHAGGTLTVVERGGDPRNIERAALTIIAPTSTANANATTTVTTVMASRRPCRIYHTDNEILVGFSRRQAFRASFVPPAASAAPSMRVQADHAPPGATAGAARRLATPEAVIGDSKSGRLSEMNSERAPLSFDPALVAYLDVLGMKSYVQRQPPIDALNAIAALRFHATKVVERNEDRIAHGIPFGSSIQAAFFSDSLAVSCRPDPDEAAWMLFDLQLLCGFLLQQGLYVRGAITVGGLFHEGSTILGPALVEAYQLEQQIARYPRIIVAPAAEALCLGPRKQGAPPGTPQTLVDADGVLYLSMYPRGGPGAELVLERAAEAKRVLSVRGAARPAAPEMEALGHRVRDRWMLRYLDSVIAEKTQELETERSQTPARTSDPEG